MDYIKCKTFTAKAVVGLKQGYTERSISIDEFKSTLLTEQNNIYKKYNIGLSAKISSCEIMFLGQEEPSIELLFIQYPKFLREENEIKKAVLELIENMMIKLNQNRVVIVFTDETVMIEKSDIIDPNINIL
jgi:Zn-dependent M16 (insulinase) family peptidase